MTDQTQEHATRSPSGSHGWRRCPGKINAERDLPDRVGIEAAEGTLFHEYAELCLKTGLPPETFPTGEERIVSGHTVSYNDEMIRHLTTGLALIAELMEPDALIFIEQKVRIERWTLEKGGRGTSDVCIIFPAKRKIIVWDWKYGKKSVSPIENDQVSLYALGCWNDFAEEIFGTAEGVTVEFIIYQPRVPGGGGRWPTTMEWLLDEGDRIRYDAALTYDPDAKRIAGDKQCLYCKAAGTCATAAVHNLDMVQLKFKDIDERIEWGLAAPELPDPNEWTPERRAYVRLHRDTFNSWLRKLDDVIMQDAKADRPTPFLKVVPGNAGRRAYMSTALPKLERDMQLMLGKKAFEPRQLVSPAVAETLLGKATYEEVIKPFVKQAEGKPMLVPITDGREAIPSSLIRFEGTQDTDNEDEE